MRSAWVFAFSILYPATSLATSLSEAHVYYFDSSTTNTRPTEGLKLDARTARLAFSRRLGLSQYHSLEGVSEDDIEKINKVAGGTSGLLGLEETKRDGSFVVIEGVDNGQIEETLLLNGQTHPKNVFTITDVPSMQDNADLVKTFRYQYADSRTHNAIAFDSSKPALSFADLDLDARQSRPVYGHINTPLTSDYREVVNDLLRHQMPLTLVLMPSRLAGDSHQKRAANAWGILENRQKAQQPEGIIEEASEAISDKVSSATHVASIFANDTTPLRGILPSCFDTQDACVSATRSCMGHGECKKKYTLKTNDNGDKTCYACACQADVQKLEGGRTKTTHWGGPACQKKDVSVPFWLLAGFTVAIISVLTWAIGLLYSMGNEELPSVIGAGVSGPRPNQRT